MADRLMTARALRLFNSAIADWKGWMRGDIDGEDDSLLIVTPPDGYSQEEVLLAYGWLIKALPDVHVTFHIEVVGNEIHHYEYGFRR